MDKYRVIYDSKGGPHPMSIEIETRAVVETQDHLIFLDEDGEEAHKFCKKEVIRYDPIEGEIL